MNEASCHVQTRIHGHRVAVQLTGPAKVPVVALLPVLLAVVVVCKGRSRMASWARRAVRAGRQGLPAKPAALGTSAWVGGGCVQCATRPEPSRACMRWHVLFFFNLTAASGRARTVQLGPCQPAAKSATSRAGKLERRDTQRRDSPSMSTASTHLSPAACSRGSGQRCRRVGAGTIPCRCLRVDAAEASA